jgi:hypothetical protein
MDYPGIMHVQANLLNGVCNVRPGEGQILKHPQDCGRQ